LKNGLKWYIVNMPFSKVERRFTHNERFTRIAKAYIDLLHNKTVE